MYPTSPSTHEVRGNQLCKQTMNWGGICQFRTKTYENTVSNSLVFLFPQPPQTKASAPESEASRKWRLLPKFLSNNEKQRLLLSSSTNNPCWTYKCELEVSFWFVEPLRLEGQSVTETQPSLSWRNSLKIKLIYEYEAFKTDIYGQKQMLVLTVVTIITITTIKRAQHNALGNFSPLVTFPSYCNQKNPNIGFPEEEESLI